ncbi:MAG: hypothetical protein ABEI52_08700, partial [Halobacteriaceae archaeon]
MRATTREFSTDASVGNLIVIAGLTAVLFAGGLALAEGIGEVGLDIDWKPFFIVYTVIIFVPWGTPTIAAAAGATLAEGLLDIFEGAAADDPFGWAGYLIGFTVAGAIFGNDVDSKVKLVTGAIAGALFQYGVEGLYLFALSGGQSGELLGTTFSGAAAFYVISTIGNTVTHGIILGAIPLLPTVDYLKD